MACRIISGLFVGATKALSDALETEYVFVQRMGA